MTPDLTDDELRIIIVWLDFAIAQMNGSERETAEFAIELQSIINKIESVLS